jgi:hypothetical protein
MDQIEREVKQIPFELISLPNKAYMPGNFNLELIDTLQKHSLNLRDDPNYIDYLNNLNSKNDEEGVVKPKIDSKPRISVTYDLEADLDPKLFDHGRIQDELQKLYDIKQQQVRRDHEGFIDVEHIDRVIDEINFTDIEARDNFSDIDTSVDNDFWEEFQMEQDSELGQRPRPILRRNKSDTSRGFKARTSIVSNR